MVKLHSHAKKLMATSLNGRLVVAISSRALFDFEDENRLFESGDTKGYMQTQMDRLETPANPGVAFSLVRKLLSFNTASERRVEVVVLSRNDPASGMRVFRSAKAHGLQGLERGVFTQGGDPFKYLRPLGAHLFLSANADDVRSALHLHFPAAHVATHSLHATDEHPNEVRIAFDGDAVLFDDEAERVYKHSGLEAFQAHEVEKAALPLPPGPFKPFLAALHRLQQVALQDQAPMRLRTALVTARSAPAHERAIRTMMGWGISVDEAMFLGGLPKGPFLREFAPDFFFDDQSGHVDNAAEHVPAGLVRYGISHENNA